MQEGQAAGRVVLEHAHVQEAHRRVALQHQPLPLLRAAQSPGVRHARWCPLKGADAGTDILLIASWTCICHPLWEQSEKM